MLNEVGLENIFNRVTLFALILALGMLVDDPIVDVENIARHWAMKDGRSRLLAAIEAVAEVGNPTVVATLTVVAALLTLVGYSMNDTIVVFDRIRENLHTMRRESMTNLINLSVNQTLSRTILTSGLTLLTALSLFLFGGQVLNNFAFALVVGILVGTYSSVFIASPILVFWQNFVDSRKSNKPAPPVKEVSSRPAGNRKAVRG